MIAAIAKSATMSVQIVGVATTAIAPLVRASVAKAGAVGAVRTTRTWCRLYSGW